MMGKKRGGEAVGGGEEAVLRGDAGEGFERFFSESTVTVVAGEGVHSNQGNGGDRIGTGRGRILEGLAADVEAAHRGGVRRTIKEAATFGVTVAGDGEVHGSLCGGEIARIEHGFVSVEKREDTENLVVERAFESGAADAVAEAAGFGPDFFQHAVEGFYGEGKAAFRFRTIYYPRSVEVSRNKHRIPGNIHRPIDEWRGAGGSGFSHFLDCI